MTKKARSARVWLSLAAGLLCLALLMVALAAAGPAAAGNDRERRSNAPVALKREPGAGDVRMASVPSTVTLTAAPDNILADGVSTSTITAMVRDVLGNPVPDGVFVGFTTTLDLASVPYEYVEAEDPTEVITSPAWSISGDGESLYSRSAGAWASWDFIGTAVSLLYRKQANGGVATVTVDSAVPIVLDTYAPSPQRLEEAIAKDLSFGEHTITVTVAGYTLSGGTDTYVVLDAFRSGTTTLGGEASAILTSKRLATTSVADVWAAVPEGAVKGMTTVTLTAPSYTMTVGATPAIILANGVSISTIRADITETNLGLFPPDGTMVGFTATLGTLPHAYVEEDDPSITYSPVSWTSQDDIKASGGSFVFTNTAGAVASWTFSGTAVSLIYTKGPNEGLAYAKIDGVYTKTIDMYDPSVVWQVEEVVSNALSVGVSHIIAVEVAGIKGGDGASANIYVVIDAFRSGTTTSEGEATATLTSGTTPGIAEVRATGVSLGSNIAATTWVTFVVPTYAMTLTADPDEIPANGSSTADVTAIIAETHTGQPAPDGMMVGFTTTLGTLPYEFVEAEDSTEVIASTGWRVVSDPRASGGRYLYADTGWLSWTFTGTAVSLAYLREPFGGTADVIIDGIYTKSISMSGPLEFQRETVISNALGPGGHEIKVMRASGRIYVDAFRSGAVTSAGTGKAVAPLTAGMPPGTAEVRATAIADGRLAATTRVKFVASPPHTVTVTADHDKIPADGLSTSIITAQAVDQGGFHVSDGTVVTFTTSLGRLGSTAVTKTTASGIATATLTSSTTAGTAIITATADSRFDTCTVRFTGGEPYTVTATAMPTSTHCGLPSTITATVADRHGNPVEDGTEVPFHTSLGSFDSDTITKPTSRGIATATLTSEVPGTAIITATADSISDTTAVTFWLGPPSTVTVEAYPTSIFADGVSTSIITATVKDGYDYSVLDGTVVTFTTSLGGFPIAQTITATTTGGMAMATLTSITITGTATIIATSDSISGTCTVEFTSVYRAHLPIIMKNYP